MNKAEFIKVVAQKVDATQKLTGEFVDAVFATITEELAEGNEVSISGFGKFSVTERASRKGINPSTMEEIEIPASKSAKFKASSTLKSALND